MYASILLEWPKNTLGKAVSKDPKLEAIGFLRKQLRQFHPQKREVLSSGCARFDQILPGGGLFRGGIIEWLGGPGDGAGSLSLLIAQRLCRDEGMLAIVDRRKQLYPPAMMSTGIDSNRVILVHPNSKRDEVWTLLQCLRCPSIMVVWSSIQELDAREYRCLQLAAETSGVVGMLVRPIAIQGQPTWADVQLRVTPHASKSDRRFVIEVVNCRQGASGKSITIVMDASRGELRECDESLPVRLAPKLANSSIGHSAARA